MSDQIVVTIEPPLTSQVDLCNIETDTSLSNVLMSENIEDDCYPDNKIPDTDTKRKRGSYVKRIKPNDVNGFDIYINHQAIIIRIFSVCENHFNLLSLMDKHMSHFPEATMHIKYTY